MSDYEYGSEINELAPRSSQPDKVSVKLKPHQLACLYKAILMEKKGTINYSLSSSLIGNDENTSIVNKMSVSTNVGILGDIVGYGKTITALSLIASSDINDIHLNDKMCVGYCNMKNYSHISYTTTNKNILPPKNIIQSTLVIVPRGPVYMQWLKTLKDSTTLKYLAVENLNYIRKHLPPNDKDEQEIMDFFGSYDVVLIKNTTLETLITYYASVRSSSLTPIHFIKRWKRIMIDEAHDICNTTTLLYYEYLWLITGTYENLLYSIRSYRNILYHIRDAINYDTLSMLLVKGTKEFVKNSFKVPVPNEKYYLCKMPAHYNVIKNFVCASILEKINANDMAGAIKDLGGKMDTKDNIIELVSNEINRELQNKEREKAYVISLDIPTEAKASRIKLIENDIDVNKNKLDNLRQRISELNTKMCSICLCDIENPIILECTHSYCASCIVRWIERNLKCPECRIPIAMDKMISMVNEIKATPEPTNVIYNKIDTLLDIIANNPNGKILVFSKYDSGFVELMSILDAKNIKSSELKGNTSHMMKVLEQFKNGTIKVILLNTNFAGSGIDISYATDVVIFHSMGLAKHQAIGRAQRVGRNDTLNIHYLCYEHEMNTQ